VNPITARPETAVAATARVAGRRRSRDYLIWVVPAVLTAVLGLSEIGVPELWRDELATWSAASRPVPQLWAMLHNIDAVLGIYYFGMHLWMSVFGDSASAMRLPSVFAMIGAAIVVALIGRRLAGNVAGLASGLVFALIPSVSRYAQEARPYAFATLFATLATLLLLRAMERPSWPRWAVYALAVAAAGAANLVAVCVIAAHAIILLIDFGLRTLRIGGEGDGGRILPGGRTTADGKPLTILLRFCLAVVVGLLIVSPLAIEGHNQQGWQIGQQQTPHVAQLLGISGGLWFELFSSTLAAAVVMLLAVLALVFAPDARHRVLAGYALACAIVPVVAVWLISRGPSSYWTFRYMLFCVPGWAIGAGLGIAFIGERFARSRLARFTRSLSPRFFVAAVLVALVAVVAAHPQINIRKQEAHNLWAYPELPPNGSPVDYQAAAAVIAANAKPGDDIIYQDSDQNHYQVDTAMNYYLRGKPNMPKPVFQAYSQVQTNSLQPIDCNDPSMCLTGLPRVWVVYVPHLAGDPFTAMTWAENSYLSVKGYQAATFYYGNGITVALLTA
jgi:mannosyltransferase